jgi:hypothetical protein
VSGCQAYFAAVHPKRGVLDAASPACPSGEYFYLDNLR